MLPVLCSGDKNVEPFHGVELPHSTGAIGACGRRRREKARKEGGKKERDERGKENAVPNTQRLLAMDVQKSIFLALRKSEIDFNLSLRHSVWCRISLYLGRIPLYASEGLEARPSLIQNAGLGLFTCRNFKKGDVLCLYTGVVLSTREAIHLAPELKGYLMRLGPNVYIDAMNSFGTCARFINDCRNGLLYNVEFNKLPEDRCAQIIAKRDIERGEELFVNYGRWYWASGLPSSRLSSLEYGKHLKRLPDLE